MKRATAQTYNSEREYRYRKVPAYPGQLHMKGWAYVIAPKGANDPEWIKRAVEYWQLQAETFGLRYEDDMKLMVDYGTGVVVTAIHVAEVLPGRRSHGYVTPRVAERRLVESMQETDDPDARPKVVLQ